MKDKRHVADQLRQLADSIEHEDNVVYDFTSIQEYELNGDEGSLTETRTIAIRWGLHWVRQYQQAEMGAVR